MPLECTTPPIALGHFRVPDTLDCWHLVDVERAEPLLPEALRGPDWRLRRRDGFALTDARMAPRDVMARFTIASSVTNATRIPAPRDSGTKTAASLSTPWGSSCTVVRSTRRSPRCTCSANRATRSARWPSRRRQSDVPGHRSPHLQRLHEVVHLPEAGAGQRSQIETGVLTDVLSMPWGVEIFGLLTRWNPLNVRRPYALPYNGKNILVVGLGPAGYTLAHHLVNEGFGVVGIDGLKIEPLPGRSSAPTPSRRGRSATGARSTGLDERVLEGFGGVSEYGITVRWDKNFLTLLHLTLARRRGLRMYGGIRFGGTLTIDDAWALRIRSCGDRNRRRAADDHRHQEQPDSRDQEGQRLPDGAAAHRRVQARRAGEPAGAAARDRDRRRPDRASTRRPS